ncbi:RHS repeat-associated core domain-containing protein [Xanthomonas axonopodis pv. nakataecorchori]|uniref:RHS repeat-associated core domain-containing protein n=2 Tax=Xanthomonas TaxID=338 RepID=UPI0035306B55
MLKQLSTIAALLMALTWPSAGRAQTVEYIHTDALGSPVAITDAAGNVTERTVYEPYGATVNKAVVDGPGYTGHVTDATTGLSYMQQRYYDPQIPRFLSVDPVVADTRNGWNFNRYNYAASNPYKFKDPDGRIIDTIADIGFIAYDIYALATEPSWTNAGALGADVVGAVVPFATGLGTAVRAGSHAADVAKAADKVDDAVKGAAGGERAGKRFTRAGKAEVKADNAAKSGGQTKCSNCGQATVPAQQSRAGVTPPKNETHVDHVIPQSKGGNGSPDNGQVLCRECNLQKGDKM